ncbi:extracellular solute-binding protein [Roseobacter sp. HKCCD9010]|uniref:ABC transporter substrate-binding protein n=1 Tax=unclassified Roseobacter TaxID=196798 RepID=UPI0014927A73|nr:MULTISPECIES: ABC transporter substrate-binding protein [unclassified Roseobacter]MBF9050493.1 extracellular solute-binding protein [Rhodobacterales bacterium HKCCD4356]NNV12090.1 extracellular solute-binding protein [Roseobacter sp. HKCCD7357]NNV17104.1 extracellular solute-binding protein [Roseobacter sp. HKCCD8768]NNV26333.1 extracellular solute-binding protein [Roseobacter sp. HKCCD8192]NNV30828.1 extracellular solute-binding protein [Roseobacter sp. HKCCD9061]
MTQRFLLGTAIALTIALPAFAQDDDLLVFDYSGFEDPAFHQPYVDTHGESPSFVFFGDEDEAFQRLVSGFQTDVTHICAGSAPRWQASGIIEPWNTDQITAFGDLDGSLVGEDIMAGSADLYFLPTDYGSTAVTYNTEQVTAEQVASLQVFTDPAFAGRLSIPDNVDDAYALAYLATGVTDWSDVSDAEFEAATDWLRSIHENLRTYWVDPGELGQLMGSGEVLVAWAWNEVPVALADEGFPVGFERNTAEGTSVWLCGYVNMTDAPGVEAKAYDYVNALLAVDSAQPLIEGGFGSANTVALASLGAETLEANGLGAVTVPVLAQLPISNEQRQRQAEAFERIKAGF